MTDYTINNTPLSALGLRPGWIGPSGTTSAGYALTGIFSLPERLGKTHHQWPEGIEPYVDTDDMAYGGRDVELSVVCRATSLLDLDAKVQALYANLAGRCTVSHTMLGSYDLTPLSADVKHWRNGWGEVSIRFREPRPVISLEPQLPPDGSPSGVDGYSWRQLGVVVSGMDGRYDLPAIKPLTITADPRAEAPKVGYREAGKITLEGTIIGHTYADFTAKIRLTQAVIGCSGIREIGYSDRATPRRAFCTDGLSVEVLRFGQTHWGRFKCKMIEL